MYPAGASPSGPAAATSFTLAIRSSFSMMPAESFRNRVGALQLDVGKTHGMQRSLGRCDLYFGAARTVLHRQLVRGCSGAGCEQRSISPRQQHMQQAGGLLERHTREASAPSRAHHATLSKEPPQLLHRPAAVVCLIGLQIYLGSSDESLLDCAARQQQQPRGSNIDSRCEAQCLKPVAAANQQAPRPAHPLLLCRSRCTGRGCRGCRRCRCRRRGCRRRGCCCWGCCSILWLVVIVSKHVLVCREGGVQRS